jgi:hypothetical protein
MWINGIFPKVKAGGDKPWRLADNSRALSLEPRRSDRMETAVLTGHDRDLTATVVTSIQEVIRAVQRRLG